MSSATLTDKEAAFRAQQFRKVPKLERFFYSGFDIGGNCSYSMINSYLNYFMTDVALISPGLVGTVMLFSKVWDAVIDPFIGYAADRTNTRWGRYRPWALWSCFPLIICNVLAFTTFPERSLMFRTIWAFSSYLLAATFFSTLNVPMSAMTAVMTLDSDERAKVASVRVTGTFITGVLLAFFSLRIVNWVQQASGSRPRGYQISAIIFGIIAIPFILMSWAGTKEAVKVEPTKEKYWKMFRVVKNNKPFWCLCIFFIMWGINSFGGGLRIYFFRYVAGKELMFSNTATIRSIFSIIGTLSLSFLIRKFKNKNMILACGAFTSALFTALGCLLPVQTTAGEYMYYVLTIFTGYAGGLNLATMFAIMPDLAEYSRYYHGVYASGFISSFINFAFQFGGALATAGVGWLLQGLGYAPNVEQSPLMLTIMRYQSHLWPAVMTAIGGVCMLIYPLKKSVYDEIAAKLERGEYAPGVVPEGGKVDRSGN
jgi:sugar (glycoside-pentoside-hexuronide) transporter